MLLGAESVFPGEVSKMVDSSIAGNTNCRRLRWTAQRLPYSWVTSCCTRHRRWFRRQSRQYAGFKSTRTAYLGSIHVAGHVFWVYESLSSVRGVPIYSSSLHLSRFVPIYQSLGQVRPSTASNSSEQTSHFVRRWRPWSSILSRANPCQQSGRAQNLPVRGETIQFFTR